MGLVNHSLHVSERFYLEDINPYQNETFPQPTKSPSRIIPWSELNGHIIKDFMGYNNYMAVRLLGLLPVVSRILLVLP